MLQAQTRWKLWSLSATAALGILSIADPAEAIGASDADKVYVSAQCGNSFKNQISSTEMQPNSVACTAYGGIGFFCDPATCSIRDDKYYRLSTPILWKDFTFEKCLFPTKKGQRPDKFFKTVHPKQFWAQNTKGTIWVNGWHDPRDQKTIRLYKCQWKNIGDRNNQRPCQSSVYPSPSFCNH
ncbi:hypothetical protein PCANC_03274 [Puccinia coronata f. sp. avenae]|uniref:Secreted protein n=1 Tax=Puccinia coronata f. sp. avenae TaxID=200324 RepID=A0A2N5VYX7_9BASI|nr:hypothetical protein PCASD_14770 [Puccinia coronata f. sp. avenae]PLW21800.1 hypothetical protein PCANC_02925 [Puccinia coronata f. sp. avenae]PLW32537.1 hypothetical protein PCASD_09742 [Puccinia coronata f. sp. avenae]PLW55185.1 hypothetical protein PCANC_03274 [Puccinia coronata f. sp. avenae]